MSAHEMARRIRERQAALPQPVSALDFMADLTGKPVSDAAAESGVAAALTIDVDGALTFAGVSLTRTGLRFPEAGLARDDATALLDMLLALDGSLAWMLGDMLVEMERQYGVTYQQVAEATGRDVATLYDYKAVAERVEFPYRNGILSWTHHKAVAYLPPDDQVHWLARAAAEGWSVARLRREISTAATPPALPEPPTFVPASALAELRYLAGLTPASVGQMSALDVAEARRAWDRVAGSMRALYDALRKRENEVKLESINRR